MVGCPRKRFRTKGRTMMEREGGLKRAIRVSFLINPETMYVGSMLRGKKKLALVEI